MTKILGKYCVPHIKVSHMSVIVNCANVKHIIRDAGGIAGETVLVKFNSRRYQAIVIDLLDWTVPRKHRAQAKPTGTSLKEAANGAGKKKKTVAKQPKSRTCKRQGKKTAL